MNKKDFKPVGDLPFYLTGADVAKYFDASRAAGYTLLNSVALSSIKISSCLRVERKAFLKWLEENTEKKVIHSK